MRSDAAQLLASQPARLLVHHMVRYLQSQGRLRRATKGKNHDQTTKYELEPNHTCHVAEGSTMIAV